MFPTLYEEMKDLIPEVYFGGKEVPPYLTPPFLHAAAHSCCYLEDIVYTIRSIGTNCSGYIDEEGIHYHIPDDDEIHVDLSKKFVFVSQPTVIGGENPSAWQIFSFLQEPARQALFIAAGRATYVEKTVGTLTLCKVLDQLWAQERFLNTRVDMVNSEEELEKGLARLMKIYEEESIGASSEMWMFWDTFGNLLMKRKLGLEVQTIS